MCWRCTWPHVVVVDEDTPEESYTFETRQPSKIGNFVKVEKTWLNKEQDNDSQ